VLVPLLALAAPTKVQTTTMKGDAAAARFLKVIKAYLLSGARLAEIYPA